MYAGDNHITALEKPVPATAGFQVQTGRFGNEMKDNCGSAGLVVKKTPWNREEMRIIKNDEIFPGWDGDDMKYIFAKKRNKGQNTSSIPK